MSESETTEAEYSDPYFERISGKKTVEWQCAVAANDRFDPDDPEYCDHEPETAELDEPARVSPDGEISVPGIPGECPECGNPKEFEVNGLGVIFR